MPDLITVDLHSVKLTDELYAVLAPRTGPVAPRDSVIDVLRAHAIQPDPSETGPWDERIRDAASSECPHCLTLHEELARVVKGYEEAEDAETGTWEAQARAALEEWAPHEVDDIVDALAPLAAPGQGDRCGAFQDHVKGDDPACVYCRDHVQPPAEAKPYDPENHNRKCAENALETAARAEILAAEAKQDIADLVGRVEALENRLDAETDPTFP